MDSNHLAGEVNLNFVVRNVARLIRVHFIENIHLRFFSLVRSQLFVIIALLKQNLSQLVQLLHVQVSVLILVQFCELS